MFSYIILRPLEQAMRTLIFFKVKSKEGRGSRFAQDDPYGPFANE